MHRLAMLILLFFAAHWLLTAKRSEPRDGARVEPAPVAATPIESAVTTTPSVPRARAALPQPAPASASLPIAPARPPAPPPPEPAPVLETPATPSNIAQLQLEELARLNDQLSALRQQEHDAESQREDAVEQKAALSAARAAATDTVRQLEQKLALGDDDGADDQLLHAESALPVLEQAQLEAARQALSQSDLFQARLQLAAFLVESEAATAGQASN